MISLVVHQQRTVGWKFKHKKSMQYVEKIKHLPFYPLHQAYGQLCPGNQLWNQLSRQNLPSHQKSAIIDTLGGYNIKAFA